MIEGKIITRQMDLTWKKRAKLWCSFPVTFCSGSGLVARCQGFSKQVICDVSAPVAAKKCHYHKEEYVSFLQKRVEGLNMQERELENQLIKAINREINSEYEKSRSEVDGTLIIKIPSPCKDIGHLLIRVNEYEILFSCAIHTFPYRKERLHNAGGRASFRLYAE